MTGRPETTIRPPAAWTRHHLAPPGPVDTGWLRKQAVRADDMATGVMTGDTPHTSHLLRMAAALRAAADELDTARAMFSPLQPSPGDT